ncbi:hypothetical protein TWF730_010576 [Orbilia blumenaviensis]|uniref:Extracellular membrane protein CFEM domain-containing protein n=1 Tax=Orbilia blumenaviensis TaxID=1796055 RepID=A0AAV9UR66_9PEZI
MKNLILKLFSSLVILSNPSVTVTAAAAPRLDPIVSAMLYGINPCIQRCVDSTLPMACDRGSRERVISCMCDPKVWDIIRPNVIRCALRKEACDPKDVEKADDKAVESCKQLGYM